MPALTIALNKGRILEEVSPLLLKIGIESESPLTDGRQLVFKARHRDIRLVIVRGVDVPIFVGRGAADIGITGKDVLLEADTTHFYEPLDLGIARCRLVRALPADAPSVSGARIRVASKYVTCARRFYADIGKQAEIIKLNGAMEIAPLLGLADEIVDIADTGNTLKANGLVAKETIAEISTRVIVNKASMKRRFAEIIDFLTAMQAVIGENKQ